MRLLKPPDPKILQWLDRYYVVCDKYANMENVEMSELHTLLDDAAKAGGSSKKTELGKAGHERIYLLLRLMVN